MQHPIFSYIVAPLIYSFVKLLCDNSELYYTADSTSDQFRAAYIENHNDKFDFIVVGAGSAGMIVANRLVQNNFKVLLLEAGGEMQPGQYIPSTSLLLLNKPQLDWNHLTVPQKKSSLSLVNQQSGFSAGKGLGGTSLLNFMIYLRGHQKDYEAWANITGDSSWNYDGVIPHFKSFEDFHGDWENQDIHGHGGELTVQPPPFLGMADYFLKAGEEKGFKKTDLNGRYNDGFSPVFYNIKNGRRASTFNAFLEPIRSNPNLTVHKFSEVTKVLLRGSENEAYGVDYIRHGELKTAFATKEIIISAGAIGSPKLLMLSGIGDRKHLNSLEIKTKLDSPEVGRNVQDHLAVYLGPFFVNQPISMLLDRDINSETMSEFIKHGTGPLTSCGTLATALLSSSFAKAVGEGDWPDIQYILLGTGIYKNMDVDFAHAFNVQKNVLKKYFQNAKGKDSFQIIVSGARPIQRGEIMLKSRNPKDELIIDPKYLDNEHDVEVLVEGIKRAIDLVENTTAFQQIGATFTTEVFPGCEGVEFRSDDYWRCLIRQYTISLHHIVGSCSMGTVVDAELRVKGAKNLRIIDASVIPLVPGINTQAPTMMVGQKGAHLILKTWKNDTENELK